MDPVDKTFDTIYSWSQSVSRTAQKSANYVSNKVKDASSSVSNGVSSLYKPEEIKAPNPPKATTSLFSLVGIKGFVYDHKKLVSSALVVTLGLTGLYHYWTNNLRRTRRKAERLSNGARKDVILIVGSIVEPLTRFIAHDLETRGFIVYITSTNSNSDLKYFSNESNQDIKSFTISSEFKNNQYNREQIAKFDYLLTSQHVPFQGAEPNNLNLVGIIVLPILFFPSGKFHSIDPAVWDADIESNLLLPMNLFKNGLIELAEKHDTNIIFITPTLSTNLNLPFHSLENISCSFLSSFCQNLSNDYDNLNITNLKLGSIRVTSNNNNRNFGIIGRPIRFLHHKIFDLVYSNNNSSIDYLGTGARFTTYFGSLIPHWLLKN